MISRPRIALAALVAGSGFAAAAPAQAALTTFANFTAISADAGTHFENSGAANNIGGSLYTVSDPASTTPGSRLVSFTFLQPVLNAAVNGATATFTLFSTTATAAVPSPGFIIQPNLTGSFSFVSTGALTVGGHTFNAGSNLLSGTFNDVTISGQANASSAGYGGSTGSGATIAYTSDFLTFAPGSSYDLSISLTSLAPLLSAEAGGSLNSFSAYSTGSFSAEPAPVLSNVPEPAAWAMMIVGFGLVGVQARRRSLGTTSKAVTA